MIDTKTAIEKITNGEFDNLFTDIYIDSSMIDYQKKRYVHAIEQYETIFCPDKVAIFRLPAEVRFAVIIQITSMEWCLQHPLILILLLCRLRIT